MNLFPLTIRTILFLIILFILPLVVCPVLGQAVQKRKLTSDFYHLWGNTHIDKISNDANWLSYKTEYENGIDTISVKSLLNNSRFYFPSGYNSTFAGNDFFVCQSSTNLNLLNLKTLNNEVISNVAKYNYCEADHNLVILKKNTDKNTVLLVRSLKNNSVREISNIKDFSVSPKNSFMIYSTSSEDHSTIHLLNLITEEDIKVVTKPKKSLFSTFTWQKGGEALAFFGLSDNLKISSLYFYNFKNKKLSELKEEEIIGLPQKLFFYWDPFFKIVISDNLQHVFFSVKPNELSNIPLDSSPEIWNANDKWIYPQSQINGNFESSPKIAVWNLKLNQCRQVTTPNYPKLILAGDFQNTVLYNPVQYEPQFNDEGPSDFYILDLNTFEKSLLLKKQFEHKFSVIPSPGGKFIAYYKDDNWWIYNIHLKSHTNVTSKIGIKFSSKNQLLSPESICGSPGWTTNDNEILIYDQYDIWAVRTDGTSFRRITQGRENNIVYRIDDNCALSSFSYIYDGAKNQVFDIGKTLILKGQGEDGKTGYFQWSSNNKLKTIIYEDSFIDELKYNIKENKFVFKEQKFNMPPKFQLIDSLSKKTTFYNSNEVHNKFFWGKSQLINYQNSKNESLKGILIYPANYDASLKYPLIVYIYELLSQNLHIYSNPTLYNESGFNPAVLSAEGYFVLMPDILLEKGNPGISAADCVIAATKKIIHSGLVDSSSVGLMGHSFGGYETSFIVTQTNLFTAAIPSGAITDLTSFYFTVNQNSGRPDWWRFHNVQWNIESSPFESPNLYDANSPIRHAEKIATPLLMWSGKEDGQVNPKQSIEFYLALRRLGKKNILLLYPDEHHTLTNTANQKDLTIRTLQWFDYFLKKKRDIANLWVAEGTE